MVVVPASAILAEAQPPQLFRVAQDSKYGYIDRSGEMIVEPQFQLAWHFSDGMAAVQVGGKWGFIDTSGKLVIPAEFDEIKNFSEGRCVVRTGEKWAFIDRTGKSMGPEGLEAAHSFSDGVAAVRISGRWGYMNGDMEMVISPRFEQAWDFTDGLAPVRINRKWGFIDRSGQLVIQPRYYWVDNFSEGLAWVEGGEGHEGYIDKSGKLVIARRFWDARLFSGGVAAVVLEAGGRFGLIDKAGGIVVEPKFEEVGLFADGLAPAQIELKQDVSRWGYIDTSGQVVIEPKFDRAEGFSGGLGEVRAEGARQYGYVDKTGKYVWGPIDPKWKEGSFVEPTRILNKTVKATVEGPAAVPARQVTVVGNPLKERYPDNTDRTFARNIWDMIVYNGRIYIGSGDYWDNAGPVDIYSFEPGGNEFTLEYSAPDEMVSRFCVFDDKLVIPGNDPQESWDLGNLYIKEAGTWRKVRTIPNGILCFDVAYLDGRLYAKVSTEHLGTIQESADWGQSWKPVVYNSYPNTLFVFQGKLHGIDWDSNLCTLENGVFFCEAMTPKLRTLVKDAPPPYGFYKVFRFGQVTPFTDRIAIATKGATAFPQYGPCPLGVLAAGDLKPSIVEPFVESNVMDACVQGDTLYILSHQLKEGGCENSIYATKDTKTWRCVATFTTETFGRSMVAVNGDFYVGLGCNIRSPQPYPASTGGILHVIPQ